MIYAVISFAAGVVFVQNQALLPPFWWALGGVVLLLFLSFFSRKRAANRLCARPANGARRVWSGVRFLTLGAACFLIGVAWTSWRAEERLQDALATPWEGRDVAVQGVIAGLPQATARGLRFELRVENILTPEVLTPEARLPQRLQLNWYAPRGAGAALPEIMPGQRWRFVVRLKKPHGSANPGGFDYEMWLFERAIRATGYVRGTKGEKLAAFVPSGESLVDRLRHGVRARFETVLPAQEWPWVGILVALAVGDQKAVEGEWWTVFNRTGTTHLMSISGLHVTMVAGMLGGLVSFFWRRLPGLALRYPAQHAGVWAAALGAFLYALLAGFGVPAQRTFYMLLVVALAMLSGRLPGPRQVLALAVLLVLLLDPWAVLAVGFWLSFGAVAALLFIASARVEQIRGWRARLGEWGSVQWAATLATLPVLMAVFQQFSLVSPLANAFAIPVISFIVTPLALLAALLPWPPLLLLAHGVLGGLMQFLVWCSEWPVWQAAAPPFWAVPLGLVGVALVLLPRGVPGRALGFVCILPCLHWPAPALPPGVAQIDVLDVGQGQAVLVRTQSHTLLYDAGPRYSAEADAGQRVVLPYLRWLGVQRIDRVVLSHGDADHIGGFSSLLAGVAVGDVLSSISDLSTQLPANLCVAGQHWQWDGVDFRLLHPLADAYDAPQKRNALSCVLQISAGGRQLLLTGDIEAADELALLQRAGKALASEVILVPHHGAAGSSSAAFVAAVGAQEAIFSAGYRNRFQHPRPEIVQRYAEQGARTWRTDTDGAIALRLGESQGEKDLAIDSWRARHARYWQGR
ncbi:DNA internalization-related competence protein ComEC/Rec2 [Azonexus sp.]|uniref:DNA internalization-related competence protein ComEC/Rec2 n=1 Tax=Azonexus sp. TaxID=1872668 RepID=UPI0039E3A545